jgi:hemerythrin-like metal-binding protein
MRIRRADHTVMCLTQMDREHWMLLAQKNEFTAAVNAGASRAELFIRLTQLTEGFQSHFDSEEGMMRSSNFTGLKLHTDEHRKLIGQIGGLRDGLGSGIVNRCDALGHFVRLWTEQHMTGPDASFAHFLHEEAIYSRPTLLSIPQ